MLKKYAIKLFLSSQNFIMSSKWHRATCENLFFRGHEQRIPTFCRIEENERKFSGILSLQRETEKFSHILEFSFDMKPVDNVSHPCS